MGGKLFIISAPSGTGKTSLLDLIMRRIERISFSVSHTTRLPRAGEQEGREYYFVDNVRFEQMIRDNEFLEWAQVHDNYYGTALTPLTEQLKRNVDVILDIDVQGAEIIRKERRLPATHIFIAPPNMKELERRLRGRGTDSEASIKLRLQNSFDEMICSHTYEYLVLNTDLNQAAEQLCAIIFAERARDRRTIDGMAINLDDIK